MLTLMHAQMKKLKRNLKVLARTLLFWQQKILQNIYY